MLHLSSEYHIYKIMLFKASVCHHPFSDRTKEGEIREEKTRIAETQGFRAFFCVTRCTLKACIAYATEL